MKRRWPMALIFSGLFAWGAAEVFFFGSQQYAAWIRFSKDIHAVTEPARSELISGSRAYSLSLYDSQKRILLPMGFLWLFGMVLCFSKQPGDPRD